MPRRSRKRSNRKRNVAQIVTIRGKFYFNMSYSSSFSFSDQVIKPSFIDRISSIRTCFEQYRFTHLSFETLPVCTGPVALGYCDATALTSPSGWSAGYVLELNTSQMWFPGQLTKIRVKVPRARINGTYKWLPTNDSLGPTGHVFIGGPSSTAVTAFVAMTYTVQFKQALFPGTQVDIPIEEKKSDNEDRSVSRCESPEMLQDYVSAVSAVTAGSGRPVKTGALSSVGPPKPRK